jgi:hypothetical protein
MAEHFEPRNDLEQALVAAQEGRISGEEFMRFLLASQVFMPVEDREPIGGFQMSTRANPLSLQSEEGYRVLVLFTSPERARAFILDFPEFKGGLLTEFKWVLERMGQGFGVSLNPGWEFGIDMEPEMVQRLSGQAGTTPGS